MWKEQMMATDLAEQFRPVAPPYVIENAYTDDQHRRMLQVVREYGPWPLILAENFSPPKKSSPQPAGRCPRVSRSPGT